MTDGRTRTCRALATLLITTVGAGALTAAPSAADPSVGEARDRAATLNQQASRLSANFKAATIRVDDARSALAGVQAAVGVQQQRLAALRQQVADGVVASFAGDPPPTGANEQLSPLVTVGELTAQATLAIGDVQADIADLRRQARDSRERIRSLSGEKRLLGRRTSTVADRADRAEKALARLRAEQRREREARRQERLSRSQDRVVSSDAGVGAASSAPASGAAATAVQYGLAQVGDAYVWGAAGPDAYDCSGLTMAAWAAAGVTLPHNSAAQMSSGTPVAISDLQPGDLVFYYSPVSHVSMYIGNGRIVDAANPSAGVRTAPVDSMPITGAVRPG